MPSSDRIVYRPQAGGNLALTGTSETLTPIQQPFYEAIVVDVIVDHAHPEYGDDGYNIGAAQIRLLSVNHTTDSGELPWADPVDFTVKQLPLVGELVVVQEIQGNKYYSRVVPLAKHTTENAMTKLNESLDIKDDDLSPGQERIFKRHQFGEYYKPDSRVRPLKHFEGDTIIEGRMGHSIRFGSSQVDPSSNSMAPSLILRTGQAKDIEKTNSSKDSIFGIILEDINDDAASIWMVADQTIPFRPATSQAGSFVRSVTTPPQKFDKAQIIINSSRVVLNSKVESIMLFSNDEINLNSYKNTTIDTDGNIFLTANEEINFKSNGNVESITDEDFMIFAGSDVLSVAKDNTSFISKKIYLGTAKNDTEPLVGGTTLSIFLARLIHALVNGTTSSPPTSFSPGANQTTHVITPMGPGLLAPAVVSALQSLYSELTPKNSGQENNPSDFAGAPFNSTSNFVMLKNEEIDPPKNQFKSGSQHSIETNEWLLSQTYYRVN